MLAGIGESVKRKRSTTRTEHVLSRRERQIMDVVYRLGEASVAEIASELPDPPSRDAVRRMAHILEEKGFVKHRQEARGNVYLPTQNREAASRSALAHLIETFFGGSADRLVAALIDLKRDQLSDDELLRIAAKIEKAAAGEEQP
jgi:predicted transcriptional regulator